MNLTKNILNTNDEISFDPTPKLKSSPIPIKFIPFNADDKNCIYCEEEYVYTFFRTQKYCRKCLSCYLTNITDNNIYLDVYYTTNFECIEHGIRTKELQVIQEVLCFKQILVTDISYPYHDNLYKIYTMS